MKYPWGLLKVFRNSWTYKKWPTYVQLGTYPGKTWKGPEISLLGNNEALCKREVEAKV